MKFTEKPDLMIKMFKENSELTSMENGGNSDYIGLLSLVQLKMESIDGLLLLNQQVCTDGS